MSGSPSTPVADDCRCFLSLTTVAAPCRRLLPLSLALALALALVRFDNFSPGLDPPLQARFSSSMFYALL